MQMQSTILKRIFIVTMFILSVLQVSAVIEDKSTSLITHKAKQNCPIKEKLWNDMATQVGSWTDALGMEIDSKIKDTVIVLNLLGFKTLQSCEGHADWGNPFPWVSIASEDSNIESYNQKKKDILEKIEKKEQELKEKNSDNSLSKIECPELSLLWKQSREISDQLECLSKMKIIKLKDLIGKFYASRIVDYDQMLILSDFVSNSYWLINIGSNWQIIRNEDIKLEKLKKYQEEMQLFAKFLKDHYWLEKNLL